MAQREIAKAFGHKKKPGPGLCLPDAGELAKAKSQNP